MGTLLCCIHRADGGDEEETARFIRAQHSSVHATLLECFAAYEAGCKKGKYDLKELQGMILVLRTLMSHVNTAITEGWPTRSLRTYFDLIAPTRESVVIGESELTLIYISLSRALFASVCTYSETH